MHIGHQLAMRLRKAYLTFHRRGDARIRPFGVTADQFVVLSLLADEDGITQKSIVERTASDPNTITAILRLLEQQGFVERKTHGKDRRARCVFLTPKGRALQQKIADGVEPLLTELWESIDQRLVEDLLSSLDAITHTMKSAGK